MGACQHRFFPSFVFPFFLLFFFLFVVLVFFGAKFVAISDVSSSAKDQFSGPSRGVWGRGLGEGGPGEGAKQFVCFSYSRQTILFVFCSLEEVWVEMWCWKRRFFPN